MKLTFDIFQEPETPSVWISHCVELDIVSQHTRPEVAIEAIAEAVRMTLQHEMKRCGLSCAEAFDAIAKAAAERRATAASAHGGLDNKIERTCHEWRALGNPPANPTTLGDVWIGNTKPTPELLKRFVTTERQAFTDGLDELQRLRAEVRELRVELSHRAGQVEGMQAGAEFMKREVVRLEAQVAELLRTGKTGEALPAEQRRLLAQFQEACRVIGAHDNAAGWTVLGCAIEEELAALDLGVARVPQNAATAASRALHRAELEKYLARPDAGRGVVGVEEALRALLAAGALSQAGQEETLTWVAVPVGSVDRVTWHATRASVQLGGMSNVIAPAKVLTLCDGTVSCHQISRTSRSTPKLMGQDRFCGICVPRHVCADTDVIRDVVREIALDESQGFPLHRDWAAPLACGIADRVAKKLGPR